MQSEIKKASLDSIANGAANELFNLALQKVNDNIQDPNTAALGKRKITLEFEFAPDQSREEIKIHLSVKEKLEPVRGVGNTVYAGKHNGENAMYVHNTKQLNMFTDGVTPLSEARNG